MARRCMISGKGPLAGNNVSHSHNKTRRRQLPNLHSKKLYVPELKRSIRIRVSAATLRSIDRMGLLNYVKKHGFDLA